ncbi:helix-turn-helix domain-containing protein [Nonomuraea harbinensis]|uniref:Helix-turn-helix domain-containing protein n=1 Tax=Nonomuraea harbinensis TaxID=1286938 RepID=A0ABW1C3W4_9ACTN|nr:helix-turn-helix domain-containing protein [Nonomuraea harbinensis]
MTADQAAHARARAQGPLRLGPGAPAPAGMTRLSGPDSSGMALPVWPDGVTPSLLEEHQVPPMPVERAGETRRVLAAVLKCCWADHSADPWPGEPAPLERVLDTYRALIGRTDDLMRNWAIGALRRLHDSAWVVVAGGIVSLGPRCALWPVESHAVLKDLVRRIPEPERRAVPVVPDAGLVAAALPEPAAPDQGAGSRAEPGVAEFDDLLSGYDERRRAELVSAFMVVEHAAEPVQEARFAALRDPALRRTLAEMLARRGRTLVQQRERWISGYADDLVRDEPPGGGPGESERAVLTLVLVHSVAIPRAEGLLPEDSWLSPHPAPVDELRRHTQLPIGELESALRALRHAGLVTQVKAGEEAGGYVPGPQFHRLTPEARRRLQEELILAAGPDTPLAVAVRARRAAR